MDIQLGPDQDQDLLTVRTNRPQFVRHCPKFLVEGLVQVECEEDHLTSCVKINLKFT